jgi:hypothetical protein
MAKKPETAFKEKIRPYLDALPHAWFEKIQQASIRGTPDFLGTIRGRFFAIELKIDGEAPDALQEYKLNQIAEAGGVGLVVTPSNWKVTYKKLAVFANGGELILH